MYFLHRWLDQARSKLGDFVFYVLFGLVVTSSVKMVGVLLVFSYLVIPLLTVKVYTPIFSKQLIYGWGVGVFASMLGLFISMIGDVPPAYAIIFSLLVMWVSVVLLGVKYIRKGLT